MSDFGKYFKKIFFGTIVVLELIVLLIIKILWYGPWSGVKDLTADELDAYNNKYTVCTEQAGILIALISLVVSCILACAL